MAKWFSKGNEGLEKAETFEEERRKAASGIKRIWLKPDKNAPVRFTFLDTEGFFFKEHQLKIAGSWQNWETCIQDLGDEDCPLCEENYRVSFVGAFTVLEHCDFVSKRTGERIRAIKKLLVVKAAARNKIMKQKERRDGDLTYCLYESTRYSGDECNTGEDFEFIEKQKKEDLQSLMPNYYLEADEENKESNWLEPYKYEEIFAPKTAAELRERVGIAAPVGSEEAPYRKEKAKEEETEAKEKPSIKELVK
jgi:hypothetical protein